MTFRNHILLTLALLSGVLVGVAPAQVAHVRQGAKLRSDPSTDHPPIRVLAPPEIVKLPGFEFRDGYYRVETSKGETGWVWGQTLELGSQAVQEEPAAGQVRAIVATNLRPDSSARQAPVGLVQVGVLLPLLAPEPENGFYKVQAPDGRDAWVWTQNVTKVAATAEPITLPAATPTTPAAPPTIQPNSTATPSRSGQTKPPPPFFMGIQRPLTGDAALSPTPAAAPTATAIPTRPAERRARAPT